MKRFTTPALFVTLLAATLILLAGPRVRGLMGASCQVIAVSATVAMPLGSWLAVLIAKTTAPGRQTAAWLLAAMLFMPLFLQAAGWSAACGHLGYFTQWMAAGGPAEPLLVGVVGAGWLHGLAATPWVALMVAAALFAVDRSEEEAALLDASAPRVLGRITLRHAAAGAVAAALWLVVTVGSEMTITNLLLVRTFAEEVYTQAVIGGFDRNSGVPLSIGPRGLFAGVGLLLLLGTVAMTLVSRWALRAASATTEPWQWRLPRGPARVLAGLALWAPMALLVAAPIANLAVKAGEVVERSGEGRVRSWSAGKVAYVIGQSVRIHSDDIRTSAVLGVAVASGATLAALVGAWVVRGGDGFGSWASRVLVAAGLVVPGPLIGVGCIWLLNHPSDSPFWPLTRPLTWGYDHTLLAPWLAQMVRATPVAMLILWPALASVPKPLLDAARADGVSYWTSLVLVAAPVRWQAISAAWLAALAVSVGELAATKLVLPPGSSTVAERLFTLLHYGVEDRVAGLSLAAMGFFLGCAAAAALLARGLYRGGETSPRPPVR